MLRRGIGPQRVGLHSENIEKNAAKLLLALQGFEGNPFSGLLQFVLSLRVARLTWLYSLIIFTCIARSET